MATLRTDPEDTCFNEAALISKPPSLHWPIVTAIFAAYVVFALLQSNPAVFLFVFAPIVLIATDLAYETADKIESSEPRRRHRTRRITEASNVASADR